MSNQRSATENSIYLDFLNGMKNQSKECVRLSGEIAHNISKGTFPSRTSDTLSTTIGNFRQLESHLENIENNLNKVCALTRNQR